MLRLKGDWQYLFLRDNVHHWLKFSVAFPQSLNYLGSMFFIHLFIFLIGYFLNKQSHNSRG